MIVIGEKINGAIPAVRDAVAARDGAFIRQRAVAQAEAGADFIDCAPSTAPELEYDAMVWLIDEIQDVTDTPICLDSPDARLLARILDEGRVRRPGMVNSVNEEGGKCELLFPRIAGTGWSVVGLTCDRDGIPDSAERKLEIARSIIEKADKYGVPQENLHIDPCVMALATAPGAMEDLAAVIRGVHAMAPAVKVTAAISNISFSMPARKYVNAGCLAYALEAGLDSAILDPCSADLMSMVYACEALLARDRGGRKYNRAYRQGRLGVKKR